ncbi:Uncharacterized protein Adt_11134 [Abeliophyllum distichum]|uniref:Uncharacterized protein n=1 Tax=Abeliophyllum distichum TaxID=126358 RepID=A0ABD1UM09_9LAMI
MKLLDRYDCYVVFSHRNRGLPSHDHFKIPNCPSSNSGWKNRYFFVKSVDGIFPFPLNWGVSPLEEFNSTPILTEPEIDTLIILRATGPLGQSMNDVLTDDAFVSAGIDRPYEDFLEELARKNSRGQRKRRRENRLVDSSSSDAVPSSGQQAAIPVESQAARTVNVQTGTPKSSRPWSPRVASKTRPTCNMRRPIEKVTEDCQAITSCLDWEVIQASKDKSPESLERSIMVEERWILSLRHSAFRKIHDQAEKIEQTGRLLEEKSRELRESRRELAEKTEMINEHTVAQLSQELAVKGKVAIEKYKGSEDYMTTVGMVGVRSRDMAFRKSREWLVERFPDIDYSGAPFMPSVEEDDDDADAED